MKYIKTFEKLKRPPKIGDWCITKGKFFDIELVDDFINNNIGYIWKFTGVGYVFIKYYNIPKEVEKHLMYSDYKNGLKTGNSILTPMEKITYLSKNKEELETIISQEKFNL